MYFLVEACFTQVKHYISHIDSLALLLFHAFLYAWIEFKVHGIPNAPTSYGTNIVHVF
jgi:hypothetical protein